MDEVKELCKIYKLTEHINKVKCEHHFYSAFISATPVRVWVKMLFAAGDFDRAVAYRVYVTDSEDTIDEYLLDTVSLFESRDVEDLKEFLHIITR